MAEGLHPNPVKGRAVFEAAPARLSGLPSIACMIFFFELNYSFSTIFKVIPKRASNSDVSFSRESPFKSFA